MVTVGGLGSMQQSTQAMPHHRNLFANVSWLSDHRGVTSHPLDLFILFEQALGLDQP